MARVYDRPIYREGNLVKKMYRNGDLIYYRLNPQPYEHMPLTFDIKSGGTIVWKTVSGATTQQDKTIQVSINGGNWTNITSSTAGTSFNVASGDTVQVRGDSPTYASSFNVYNTFSDSTAAFDLYGNIMSLVDSTGYTTAATLTSDYTFVAMFSGCTGLQSAKNLVLPATTLTVDCYYNMFNDCTSLTTPPSVLPAETAPNYCYAGMFYGCSALTASPVFCATTVGQTSMNATFKNCTSLTTAPVLSATTLGDNAYYNMFQGCTSLTAAPELPATTLGQACYYHMFDGCTALTTAPSSIGTSSTTMALSACTSMFSGCTSLTTPPVLPSTAMAAYCYAGMFYDCSGLTSAPVLPALTLANYCYNAMFRNCTSLTVAPSLPATTLGQSCYTSMFNGCTALTTGPSSIPATSMANSACTYMFYGCTSLVTAPALSASTLATYCYYQMFAGCTSLVTAPDLNYSGNATTSGYWYQGMFSGCSSLNHIKCLLQGTSRNIQTVCQNWTTGVAENGTFIKNRSTTWPTGVNGIPSGWTVTDAS